MSIFMLVRQKREKFVITSKVWGDMDPSDPNAFGLSRHHIMDNIDKSLKRLQTHYLDLYLVSIWPTLQCLITSMNRSYTPTP